MAPISETATRMARMWLPAMALVCALGLVVSGSAHAAKCTKTGTSRGDFLTGTKHKDIICGKGGNDILIGLGGNDELRGSSGDDVLSGGTGNDKLKGQTGADTASYAASATAVTVDLGGKSASGEGSDALSSIENVTGSAQADTLRGDAIANAINGGLGDDTLAGGDGDDSLTGGAGTDTVTFAAATGAVTADLATAGATGQGTDSLATIENVTGSPQGDTLTGDGAANIMAGGAGDDTLSGGMGDDQLSGEDGNDQLHGDPDDDTLSGGPGGDLLDGGSGLNSCDGGIGTDQLLDNCDRNAPALTSFSVTPSSVETSQSARAVTVTLDLTDDVSGVDASSSQVSSTPPGGGAGNQGQLQLTSGTSTDGTYQATINVPRFSVDGTWTLDLSVVDGAGNQLTKTSAQLISDGYPGTFEQTGLGDTAAPVLTSFALAPSSIDTSLADQVVTFTLHLNDDVAGVDPAASQVSVAGPTGQAGGQDQLQLTSGTASDGDYQATVTVPQGSLAGTWTVNASFVDQAGNQIDWQTSELTSGGFPATFQQTGDTTAPTVTTLSVSPDPVDTGLSAQDVTVTLHLTDDLAGVDAAASHVDIYSPDAQPQGQSQLQLVSGGPVNGNYTATFNLPQDSERGEWSLSVTLVDQDGNQRVLTSSDLIGLGLPGKFNNNDLHPT